MKYFSMFSGVGGFELGIQKSIPNTECVGYSEIDKYAISIYKKHFKNHKNYGDATKIIPRELPDFDCLVGGFPCQAFSVAGKRAGFGDTRGTMFFEIARIVREKQPRFLVLENVKGLLSHNKGNSANIIASTLDELGYNIEWQVCNSKNHGVPQNRERIFIIGHLRASGKSARQIFSIGKSHDKTIRLSSHQANTITARYGRSLGCGSYIGGKKKIICFNAERGLRDKDPNPNRGGGSGMLSREDGLSYAITANSANHPIQIIGGCQASRVYDPSGIAITQSALGGGGGAKTGLYAVNGAIRTLMPIECERLQGFPDRWSEFGSKGEKISDTQRYKCIGNAITVNVVKNIFDNLYKKT